jgi:hypothetical protein
LLAVAGDYVEKSLDFAQDSVKQLIALPTAIVTITVTFATDLVGADVSLIISKWAWVVLVVPPHPMTDGATETGRSTECSANLVPDAT